MRKTFIILFLSLFACGLHAQQPRKANNTISGSVIETKTKEPVSYASVSIKDSLSRIITGVITDEKGQFLIDEVPVGNYTLEIQFMGFAAFTKAVDITSEERKLDLGAIGLDENAIKLDELVVTADKTDVLLTLDKKVYQVGLDIIAQNGSASDILNNVPSVTVGTNGVVSLRGNSNVLILINGRRSGLTLNNALDQIPADNIEKIEVIMNPSARYDAAGSAGIINILLKKNKTEGFSAQVRVMGGIPNDQRLTGNMNYKAGKLNIFSNIGYRYSDYVGVYSTNQTTNRNGVLSYLNQVQDEDRHDGGRLFYLGADFFVNDKNMLTAAFYKNATNDTDGTVLNYQYASAAGSDSTLLRNGNSKEIRDYNQLEFNYARTFAKPDKKFTVDMQYDFWNSDKKWDLYTQKIYPEVLLPYQIKTSSISSSKDFVLKTDFVLPIGDKYNIELGAKVETRIVTSDFLAEEQTNEEWRIFQNINNVLDYNERIGGIYVQYGSKLNKFNYLLGARSEVTKIEIEDRANTFSNRKNYTRFFPTVNVSYAFGEESTVQLSYSKRINRPSLYLLYPFNEITDFNSQFVGNPDLNPSYTDGLELGLLQHWGGLTFNPSLYYKRTTDFVQYYAYRDSRNTFIVTPVNLDQEQRYGIELSSSLDATKWLQVNGEFNAYDFNQQGIYSEQNFAFSDWTWNTRVTTRIKFPQRFTLQCRYNHTGIQNNAQSRTRALYYFDLGLTKNIFKDKATIALNASNIFNTRKTTILTIGENYSIKQVINPNAQRYSLSFLYKFNKKDEQGIRNAKSGNRD
jgi:outer membrane receptor protein involved in Fe transport